jgi:hypothetical protein
MNREWGSRALVMEEFNAMRRASVHRWRSTGGVLCSESTHVEVRWVSCSILKCESLDVSTKRELLMVPGWGGENTHSNQCNVHMAF